MSFRETPSAVSLCNRALSHLAQGPITSVDPPAPGNEASKQCKLWYKTVVARLLEAHHWGLATKQAVLASIANDRSDWLYALAAPDDIAFAVSMDPLGSGSGMQYYRGLGGLLASRYGKQAFMVSGSTIYSNASGPLSYVSLDITEADFTATFANIVELSLAAKIAYAITKNKKIETDLRSQATNAMNLAITQNLNAGNPRYGGGPSERDIARGTYAPQQLPSGYGFPPGTSPEYVDPGNLIELLDL